jgi:hypothetical protein
MKRVITKVEVLRRLRRLRMELEASRAEDGLPGQLPGEQAAVLTDVCQKAFGLNDPDTYYVVGEAFLALTDRRDNWPALRVPAEVLERERAHA